MLQWTWEDIYLFKRKVLFPLGIYPEEGLLDHMAVVFFFYFLRDLHTVFHSSCMWLHSPQQCTKSPFTHILASIWYLLSFLKIAILTAIRWYHIVVLICIYLICWASFHVPFGPLYVFFGKMSIQISCPFFNWVIYFFAVELYELLVYFKY